jgi:methylated-DNA-[protein]-cysteine S-methyltransferase
MFLRRLRTPLGELRLIATDEGLSGVYFPRHRGAKLPKAVEAPSHPVLDQAVAELRAYLRGERVRFETRLAAKGTHFQRQVWAELLKIPFGQTRSYADVARQLGRPSAARAVGAANARNPVSIFVPCHRVVAAGGGLAGYAGGKRAKRWLLAHEKNALSYSELR